MMRPSTDTAKLAFVAQERMTRSLRTSPVRGSTFSAPKKCSRMAMVAALKGRSPSSCAEAGDTNDVMPDKTGRTTHASLPRFTISSIDMVSCLLARSAAQWFQPEPAHARRCHLGSVRSAACEQEKQRAAASAMPRAEQRLRLFDNVETYRENGRHARRFKQRLIEQGGDVFACCVPPPNW